MGEYVCDTRLIPVGKVTFTLPLVLLFLGLLIGVLDNSMISRLDFTTIANARSQHGTGSWSITGRATSVTTSTSKSPAELFGFHGYNRAFDHHSSTNIGAAKAYSTADNIKNTTSIWNLPSLASTGGVMVFLHVPKTGGTTIRKTYQKRENVTYLFSNRKEKYNSLVPIVNEWVRTGPSNKETVVFNNETSTRRRQQHIGILEIHARNNPSLITICDQLQQWKATAKEQQIPFFAFTVVREPESFGISYFNYYHGMRWEKRRFEFLPRDELTNDNFRRTMHHNPQCLFLTRSEQAYQKNFPTLRQNRTREECLEAYDCLRKTMDWIGTTERLQNETLPLLQYLLLNEEGGNHQQTTTNDASKATVASNSKHAAAAAAARGTKQSSTISDHENTGPKLFGRSNMTNESQKYLTAMTEWDRDMYLSVLRDYDFSKICSLQTVVD